METILRRMILAVCIGILSFGFSHIIPHGLAYGEITESEPKPDHENTEDNTWVHGEDGDATSQPDLLPVRLIMDNSKPLPHPKPLSVHLTIDASNVNPMVRERYNIYAKLDPENPKSKRFHFKVGKDDRSDGSVIFTGVKEGKRLQLFVVKDNFQRDCIPEDAQLKQKVDKDSTIDSVPTSVSIKLVQSSQYLYENDIKKFSGHEAVPECVITAMEFGK